LVLPQRRREVRGLHSLLVVTLRCTRRLLHAYGRNQPGGTPACLAPRLKMGFPKEVADELLRAG
jgi:hypothetical protein